MRTKTMFVVASLALATSCSSTKVNRTWMDPGARSVPLGDVLVVAVVRQEGVRRTYENDIAAELSKRGIRAVPSHQLLPATQRLTAEAVRALVEREHFDQVLVTNYRGTETEVEYVPGTVGYYGYMGMAMASPGYVRETTIMRLETKLFDAEEGGRLIWSAESSTRDPSVSEKGIRGVAKELVEEMVEDIT